jgi:hypothetical protein
LGALLQDPKAMEQAAAILRPVDFYLDAHRHIFSVALALHTQGAPVDALSVGELLQRRDQLQAVGGTSYLASLVDRVPSAANVAHYCGIVRDKSKLRQIAEACIRAGERARGNGTDPGGILADLWEELRPLESPDRAPGPILVRLEDVQPEPITWLWPGHIPIGKLTLFVGDPGEGKSYTTEDLAARVSRGASWPDGEPGVLGNSIILTAEDGLADTVRPRIDLLDGDPGRVVILTGIGDPERPSSFNLARDLVHLEDAVLKTRAILVVVDPVSAYLEGVESHRDADVRSVLAPLCAMAERNRVAIVGVMHLNKSDAQKALYRASGSLAFVAQARGVFAFVKDQECPGRRLFLPLKMNIAPHPPTLAFRLDGGRLTWEQGTVCVDTEAALAGVEERAERGERDEAKEFLREVLRDGSAPADDVKKQARAVGISESTLRRARSDLKIKPRKVGYPGVWMWDLAAKVLSADLGEHREQGEHLRASSADVSIFELAHPAEGAHEDAHSPQQVSIFDTPQQQQQGVSTTTTTTKNTKMISESEEKNPW